MIGSETSSAISSRGEYFFPFTDQKDGGQTNFQTSSYDLYAPPWGNIPDVEFKNHDKFPFASGEFVWTGFDYLGEPTPYSSNATKLLDLTDPEEREKIKRELEANEKTPPPSRSSYFGINDLAGFKKTASTSIRPTGGRTCPWPTSCRIGTGRIGSARSPLCTCIPPVTRPNFFSMVSRSVARERADTNTACAGTT